MSDPSVGQATARWLCPKARPAALTRMLGSSRECRARTIASSETRVSPLVWISSTAIWEERSAAMSARSQALGQSVRASQRDIPWQGGSCGAPDQDTQPGQARLRLWPQLCPEGPALLGSPVLPGHCVPALGARSSPTTAFQAAHRLPAGQTWEAAPWAPCGPKDNADGTNSSTVCRSKLCLAAHIPSEQHGLSLPLCPCPSALPSQGCHSPRRKRRHWQRQPSGTSQAHELSLLLHPGQGGPWQRKMFC